MEKNCKTCKRLFKKTKTISKFNWSKVQFCSRTCKRHTKESIEKNRNNHLGKRYKVNDRIIKCSICYKQIELRSSYYVGITKTCSSKECISIIRKKNALVFYKQNPNFYKVLSARWKGDKNPNWNNGIKKSYRIRKYEASGSHTKIEWESLKIECKFMCLCCKQQEPQIKLTEDHIIPLIKGGSDFIENIQPLCITCNKRKARKIVNYKNLE